MCASTKHFAAKCPNRKGNDSANMVISEPGGISGYGNLLPTVLSVFCSPEWWVDTSANIHVCANSLPIVLCFLLTRSEKLPSC